MRPFRSPGDGRFAKEQLGGCGARTIIEAGVLVFHPVAVFLGDDVYVGHQSLLFGYHKGEGLRVGAGTWVGPQCYLHAAGGITIEDDVGIGAGVKVLTSQHGETPVDQPIMAGSLTFGPVRICRGADVGVGAIILPGVTIGAGAQVGAGAVVAEDVPPGAVVVGVPARLLRYRPKSAVPTAAGPENSGTDGNIEKGAKQ